MATDHTCEINDADRLWSLLDGFQVAMVTTMDGDMIRARPMAPFIDKANRRIEFLTHAGSPKTGEIAADERVCLNFMNTLANDYVSVSGRFVVDRRRSTVERLWGGYASTWFEGGPDNEDIVALRVAIEKAQYWDGTRNILKAAWELATAYESDSIPKITRNAQIG